MNEEILKLQLFCKKCGERMGTPCGDTRAIARCLACDNVAYVYPVVNDAPVVFDDNQRPRGKSPDRHFQELLAIREFERARQEGATVN